MQIYQPVRQPAAQNLPFGHSEISSLCDADPHEKLRLHSYCISLNSVLGIPLISRDNLTHFSLPRMNIRIETLVSLLYPKG